MTRRWEKWEPNWQFDGVMSQYRGGVGGFLWYPVLQDAQTIAYSQLGTGWIRNAYFANYGMGVRRFLTNNFVLGANGFIDISYSDHEVSYYQGGFGLEALGRCWEVQANGYFPKLKMTRIDQRVDATRAFLVLDPNNNGMDIAAVNIFNQALECSYYGWDILAGVMRDIGPGELWGRAGYYSYRTQEGFHFQGPRLIAEYISKPLVGWGAQVFFGVNWEHDRLHGSQTGAHVGFRIPFCWYSRTRNWCKSSLCRRVAYAVRRQPGVRIEREARTRFGAPQVIANALFVEENGMGTGTQADPTNITAALAAAAPNDLIFFLQSNGNIIVPAASIDLTATPLPGVVLAGFGANGTVANVPVAGRVVTITALPGQAGRAILNDMPAGSTVAITLDNNNRVQGLGIDGTMGGILSNGRSGTVIDDVTITNLPMAAGIELTDSTGNNTISNSTFTALQNQAILISQQAAGLSSTIRILNSTINNINDDAIQANIQGSGASTNILVEGTTVTGATLRAFDISNDSVNTGVTKTNLILRNNMLAVQPTASEPINITAVFVNQGDEFNALLEGNRLVSPPTIGIEAVQIAHAGSGATSFTLTNNTDTGNTSNTEAYVLFRQGAAAPGVMCGAATGNSTQRTVGFSFDANPATLEIERLNLIPALNNGLTFTTIGNPQNVPLGTCKVPVIP